MAYIGNLDISNYKIYSEWITNRNNHIRHVSIDNHHFFEMKTQEKINFYHLIMI